MNYHKVTRKEEEQLIETEQYADQYVYREKEYEAAYQSQEALRWR